MGGAAGGSNTGPNMSDEIKQLHVIETTGCRLKGVGLFYIAAVWYHNSKALAVGQGRAGRLLERALGLGRREAALGEEIIEGSFGSRELEETKQAMFVSQASRQGGKTRAEGKK